jgi:hypothetical protein
VIDVACFMGFMLGAFACVNLTWPSALPKL